MIRPIPNQKVEEVCCSCFVFGIIIIILYFILYFDFDDNIPLIITKGNITERLIDYSFNDNYIETKTIYKVLFFWEMYNFQYYCYKLEKNKNEGYIISDYFLFFENVTMSVPDVLFRNIFKFRNNQMIKECPKYVKRNLN